MYSIHPGVAEAGRAEANAQLLAAIWQMIPGAKAELARQEAEIRGTVTCFVSGGHVEIGDCP